MRRICAVAAGLMLLASGMVSAQGPQLGLPDFSGPVILGPARTYQVAPHTFAQGGPAFAQPQPMVPSLAPLLTAPAYEEPLQPIPDGPPVSMGAATGCDLFPNVKYHNTNKISPCAVPMIVGIKDPCAPKKKCSACAKCGHTCDSCAAAPQCVYVKICVPTCGCPKVRVKRDGDKIRYDYGKYAIDVVSRNGKIFVDYDKALFPL